MGTTYTPASVTGTFDSVKLAQEFDNIRADLDRKISKFADGTNQMESILDMSSNRVTNVGEPVDPNDAVRLLDLQSAVLGDFFTDSSLQLRSELASTSTNFGASLVGIEDAAGNFTATDVEDALTELATDIDTKVDAVDNAGSGAGVAQTVGGTTAVFRSLVGTAPITVTEGVDEVTFAATIATQAEAVAGSLNDVLMTPLRVQQAIAAGGGGGGGGGSTVYDFVVAASDETTAISAGTAKVTFRIPRSVTLSSVRASLSTAQTSGSIFTVDINKNGTSILSTKLTIDNNEKTSSTAATPPVLSTTALTTDDEITIDVDQIGGGTAKGLKVILLGNYA